MVVMKKSIKIVLLATLLNLSCCSFVWLQMPSLSPAAPATPGIPAAQILDAQPANANVAMQVMGAPAVQEPAQTVQPPAAVMQPPAPVAPTNQTISNVVVTPVDQTIQPKKAEGTVVTQTDSKDDGQEANIYLNFENASLLSVVNYLGEQKKINIIPNKDLEATKVSLTTRTPLTLNRAWNVLLTLLESNGFSLIKVGNTYRVALSKDNGLEPLPTYSSGSGTEPEQLPDSDLVVRYVYFFKNIKVETAKTILSKMMDEKSIITNVDLNACIIKEQCLNIKAAMKIVKELDSGGLRESIAIIPLRWANADNVKKLFDDVLAVDKEERIIRFTAPQQKENAYFSSATKILPEPVKNSLILLGTKKNIEKIKDFIYKNIDVPIDDAESRLHIKALRYMKAQDVKPILDEIIKPPKGAASEKGLVMEGGYKTFEDVIISAEQEAAGGDQVTRGSGNRLIIACNKEDWKRLEQFIDKIDKPQPQVAIEVMVADVKIGQTKQLGAQMYDLKGKPLARGVDVEFANLTAGVAKGATPPTTGGATPVNVNTPYITYAGPDYAGVGSPTFFTLGAAGTKDNPAAENIWSIIKAVIKLDNSQIISQPYIIANNNQKCLVSVKTTMRIPGKLSKNTNVTSGPAVREYENIDAEVKVELTPYINLIGTIDLNLDISVDEFVETDVVETPTRTKRRLNSKASMGAGEVLVLGGLTKSKLTEQVYKTPILADIPLIGSLFKNKSKIKEESNLYVFIRPSIIKPRFEGSPDEYTQLKLDYAKYQIMKGDMYVHDKDPIQRWFFRPTNQTIRHRIEDYARGVLRPVDDYTYGRSRPKSVNIHEDPYFKTSEAIEKERQRRESEKAKEAARYTAAAKTVPGQTNALTASVSG